MGNLSQTLNSYFLCMDGPLRLLTLRHARKVGENNFSVTVELLII